MENGGSARNLKLGRRAGGNRNRDALAWDDLRSTGNRYPLASYARQADGKTLENHAMRIRSEP
jgi:hypothetical protein